MVSILLDLYKKKRSKSKLHRGNVAQKLFYQFVLNLGGIGPTPTLPIGASGGV